MCIRDRSCRVPSSLVYCLAESCRDDCDVIHNNGVAQDENDAHRAWPNSDRLGQKWCVQRNAVACGPKHKKSVPWWPKTFSFLAKNKKSCPVGPKMSFLGPKIWNPARRTKNVAVWKLLKNLELFQRRYAGKAGLYVRKEVDCITDIWHAFIEVLKYWLWSARADAFEAITPKN